jgi:O-methyltransferase domain
VSGDFLSTVSSGGDIYILKQILHNWDDAECIRILSHCRNAMNKSGRVLVMDEIIVPGKKEARNPALLDLQMLLLFGSRKRTEAEHRPLFESAGFHLTRVLPTTSTYYIFEAVASESLSKEVADLN